jgi:hypothetical protein
MSPPNATGINAAKDQLEAGRPVQFTSTIAEIICAAWELREDPALWQSNLQWLATNYQMLTELVLKSAESIEYWERIKASANAK